MNLNEKLITLKKSCEKLLEQDTKELNEIINTDIEKQIKDELDEYQAKEELAYNKKIEKMEKEYNKQIYSLQMDSKKEILNQKSIFEKKLKNEITQILCEFTEQPEYESFLFSNMEQAISKLKNKNHFSLGIVKKDFEKYENKIRLKYNVDIMIIDDKYIGGCMIEDKEQGLFIDNTIKNSIDEKKVN